MSKFLYKIGYFAARKAWAVITVWALVLAGLAGVYTAFHGELSNQVTIPGTEAQQVQETLADKFDTNTSAGFGQIILETKDGKEFTDQQKQAVAADIAKAKDVEQVGSVVDPFATAQQIKDGQKKLSDGKTKLEQGEKQMADAQAKLDDTQKKIDDGSLAAGVAKQLDDAQAKLDESKQKFEQGKKQAEDAQKQLDDGQKQIDEQRTQLQDGKKKLEQAQSDLDKKRAEAGMNPLALPQLTQAQKQIDENRKQLEDGEKQLSDAQVKIDQGRKDLEDKQPELAAAQQKIDDGQKKVDEQRQKLESGQTIKDAQKQVDDGQKKLDAKKPELESGRKEIERNQALLDMNKDAVAISKNKSAAIVNVSFTDDIMAVSQDHLESTREAFSDLDGKGINVLYDTNLEGQQPEMGMTGEIVGIIIALIVLFVMMGTFIAAGLPILMAVLGLAGATMGTLALSNVVDMTSTTPALGSMLGLAVGIDYTLFIMNRHRNNLAQGMDVKRSIALATGTAGSAVLFAGTTVMIALLSLNVVGIPFLSVMGNAAAFAVLMAVLVAITLSPAILSLAGRRIISKRRWATIERRQNAAGSVNADVVQEAHEAATAHEERKSGWLKAILAQPIVTILVVVLGLGALAMPMADLRLGLPTGASQAQDSPAYKTYKAIEDNFGAGQNGTIIAAANLPEGTTAEQAKDLQVEVGQDLLKQNDVEKVVPAMIAKDNSTLLYQITPQQGPSDESTENLVTDIRNLKLDTSDGQVTFGVTGQTAMNIDISKNLAKVLPIYIAIILGLSLLVLILVFRSIWVPVTATLGFLFSFGAALGATVAVFQWGWLASFFGVSTPGPILSFLPILAVGILFGLAMDYQLFLVSAMREAYSHGREAKTSVIVGFKHSAKVVVAAALIMAGVFLGFVFSGDPMMASIGFALAMGVIFDAFVVRMTLIPALMYLLGKKAWWLPRWLDKILPDLDVEGTKLERDVEPAAGGSKVAE
ncbi:MAG: MMPL family transporter [Rothia sp. (in: high G+C Gram-positive bacteria)]|nr:MMPL family transporter [Rothia sp. (in: high G+C Gram-positive bacteria)]